jgi:hypothetical protein
MSLLRFALTVAGPRDALINLIINAVIPWFFLRRAQSVPLLGWFSVEIFLAPMFFLLFSLATFFGIMNGVIQRQNGWSGEALDHSVGWRRWALGTGLTYGFAACSIFLLGIHLLDHFRPGLAIPAVALIVLQATLSAVLGYCVQVHGVLASRRL